MTVAGVVERNGALHLAPTLDGWGFEEGAIFTVQSDKVVVSVSQECAVDSYNQSFTCALTMTLEQAEALHGWLGRAIASMGEPS